MNGFTYAELAIAAELEVLGRRARLEVCRGLLAKGRYPEHEVTRQAEALPKHEAIAECMKRAAEREARG